MDNNSRLLLSSIETEYALTVLDNQGKRLDPRTVGRTFMQIARKLFPHISAAESGIFLPNGGRLYIDSGYHPEYAAPECAGHPNELVAHVKAGHEIVALIAKSMEQRRGIGAVRIWRGNIDYRTKASWGSHQNDLSDHKTDHHIANLLPFLVSRVIIGGAGGWIPTGLGLQFCLSPRLIQFRDVVSEDTQYHRPLINIRDEPHAERYYRVHLICRDSLISERAERLTIGLMRLVLRLSDLGIDLSKEVQLSNPLKALRAICLDPSCQRRVLLNNGKGMTAIEIQRYYLAHIEKHLKSLPDWAAEILEEAKLTLDQLSIDPLNLVGILDWPTKLMLFQSQLPQQSWDQLQSDSELIETVYEFCGDTNVHKTEGELHALSSDYLLKHTRDVCERKRDVQLRDKGGIAWVDEFANLRNRMFYLDVLFSDLENTLWQEFADHSVNQISTETVQQAVNQPPTTTRAKLRGELVTEHSGDPDYHANWTHVTGPDSSVDLSDPFATQATTSDKSMGIRDRRNRVQRGIRAEFVELLTSLPFSSKYVI